jgi:hypothetical protein
MAVKIKVADTWFSKCVRERADWTCERCGSVHERGSMGLHCSHIFSRRHRTLRWCGDNAQALCFGCHSWYGGSPADSGRWIESVLGEGYLDILREKRDAKIKIPVSEEKDIARHYRNEFRRMEEERDNGAIGRLEFESYQ